MKSAGFATRRGPPLWDSCPGLAPTSSPHRRGVLPMAWLVAIVVVVLYIQFREQIAELRGIVARLQDEVRELRRQVAGAPIAGRRETERPPVVHAPSPSTPRIVPTASRPTTPLAPAYVPPRKYAAEER